MIIVSAALVIVAVWIIFVFNKLISLRNQIKNAF